MGEHCQICGRSLSFGSWTQFGNDPPEHMNCDAARVTELEDAIERIWGETGCFPTAQAEAVAVQCHEIAHEVKRS